MTLKQPRECALAPKTTPVPFEFVLLYRTNRLSPDFISVTLGNDLVLDWFA